MFVKSRHTIKTLIPEFDYPRFGPGMMWSAMRRRSTRRQGRVRLGAEVITLRRTGARIDSVVVAVNGRQEVNLGHGRHLEHADHRPSGRLDPPPRARGPPCGQRLSYRDFSHRVLDREQRPHVFPDELDLRPRPGGHGRPHPELPELEPFMVPDPAKSSLGLEYFCTENDRRLDDARTTSSSSQRVTRSSASPARAADVGDGCVFRVPKAYPVYDPEYREHLAGSGVRVAISRTLQTVGRNGPPSLQQPGSRDDDRTSSLFGTRAGRAA